MTSSAAEQEAGTDGIVESVLAVAFDAMGRRRRAQTISRRQEEWLPDLVIVDGPTFWARSGETVQTNGGEERHSHGGTDIVNLLLPSRIPDGYYLSSRGEEEEIAGRMCKVATAVPREPDPYGRTPGSEVFDMIAGGILFRLSIDLQTGVLMRVAKLVDDAEAEICEFLDITFDAPLADELFAPLA